MWRSGCLASSCNRHPKTGVGQTGKQRRAEVAVLSRRQPRDDRLEEVSWQFEVSITVVLLERPAHPDRASVFVEVSDLACLEFGDARAALIDDEQGENVFSRDGVRDALDMLRERRRYVSLALPRKLHPLVASWVRVDAIVVETLRQCCARLPHGLALIRMRRQCGDKRPHVVDRDLVDLAPLERGSDLEDPCERRTVHVARLDFDVAD